MRKRVAVCAALFMSCAAGCCWDDIISGIALCVRKFFLSLEAKSVRSMDLKYVQGELQKLSELIGGWGVPGEISVLERELALEKLRKLYENIRFEEAGEPVSAEFAEPASDPEPIALSIDLGEILALDPLPDAQPEAGPESRVSADFETKAFFENTPAAESEPSPEPFLTAFADGKPAAGEPAIAAEKPATEPAVAAGKPAAEESAAALPLPSQAAALVRESGSGINPIAVSDPTSGSVATGTESEPAGALVTEPVPTVSTEEYVPGCAENDHSVSEEITVTGAPSIEEPAARKEGAPEGALEPSEEAASESEHETEITPEPAPAAAPQPVAPTLFELEETVRHRRKQRVIMSLYDAERPAEKRTPDKPAGDKPAPIQSPAPHPRSFFGDAGAQGGIPAEKTQETEVPHIPDVSAAPEQALAPDLTAVSSADSVSQRANAANNGDEPAGYSASAAVAMQVAAPVFASADEEAGSESEYDGPEFEEITLDAHAPGSVLGEVINHDVQTLADTLVRPRDVASELRRSEPLADLRRAIGINDKFLMIRDLFGGDGAAYEEAIDALNGFEDLDDCMIHIAENYAWNPNSDGAKFIMELLERKFA